MCLDDQILAPVAGDVEKSGLCPRGVSAFGLKENEIQSTTPHHKISDRKFVFGF